jgi:hypothetical protein
VLAYFVVMARYVVGLEPLGHLLSSPQWEPPLGWIPLVIAYGFVSLGLVALVGGSARWIARREAATAPGSYPDPVPEGAEARARG